MALDFSSSAVYSPPPTVGLFEAASGRGIAAQSDEVPPSPRRRRVVQPENPFQSPGTVQRERAFQSSGTVEIESSNPLVEHIATLAARHWKDRRIRVRIEDRLRELQIDARRGGDPLSEASLSDLRAFLKPLALAHRPAIFLLDNGNFRALWRNEAHEHVGLQFLGGRLVQYVIFARRENPPVLTTHAGSDTVSTIRAQITANACDHLLFG